MGYRFTYDPSWKGRGTRAMQKGLARLAAAIHEQAVKNAPKRSRALANSGQFTQSGELRYTVKFGGGSVPYAKKREYENKLHPDTRFYLRRARDSAAGRVDSFFNDKL